MCEAVDSHLSTHISGWDHNLVLCFQVHTCCRSVTNHGCMCEKFVIWKQKLPCWWKGRKPIWGIWMEYISWKGPVMSEFWLDAACFLWGLTSQHKRLRCCHWRTIIDIYIGVLIVWTLAVIQECLPVTLRKQCFLYRKGSQTWGMGVLVYHARFMHCLSGIGGCFYAVHQNPLQTVSWIMQCFRWKYSLGHLLSLQTGVLHWAWRVLL